MTTDTIPAHPATYSTQVLAKIREVLAGYFADDLDANRPVRVLDPFAGTGGIHELRPTFETWGVELEREWADAHPCTHQGDALHLGHRVVDAVVTSPCYGNRMADHHDAVERCTTCAGTGQVGLAGPMEHGLKGWACTACGGSGRRGHKRITYRHKLGRALTPGSAAGMQWGPEYRRFHIAAWTEALRVIRPDGILVLNISDHVRNGELQRVPEWHVQTIQALGARLYAAHPVETPRMGFGANREARAEYELVVVFKATTPGAQGVLV